MDHVTNAATLDVRGPRSRRVTSHRVAPHERARAVPAAPWGLVACALPGIAMLLPVLSTIDVAYLVRSGELMLDGGGIIRTDPFGLATMGGPWVNQQWLSEIALALVYRAGGWEALVVARAVLFSATFSLVYAACRARGASVRSSALLTIGAYVVAFGLDLRAELLGMALFAFVQWLLAIRHRWRAALWLIPAAIAVWSNVHGSFFLGPVIVALAYLEDRSERRPTAGRTLGAAALGLGATLVNPFGFGVWPYALGLSTSERVTDMITEWAPTTIRSPFGVLFFGSAALVGWILLRRARPAPLTSLLGLGFFAAGALWAIRGVAWWALAVPPIVAALVQQGDAAAPASADGRRGNRVFAVLLAVLAVACVPWWRTMDRPTETLLRFAPAELTAALADVTGPETRLFNPQPWGSWLELALPGRATFVDARIEVPPDHVWSDYDRVSAAAPGWETIVDRWDFDVIVVARSTQSHLITALGRSDVWREVYSDDDGTIFVRS